MNIDYTAAITTLALIVALGVAIRDSYLRVSDRKRRTKLYISYYTPSAKLLLQRLLCVKGTIEKYKSIRLGAQRPHDAFRVTSLVIKKISIWEQTHTVSELSHLKTDQALKFSRIMGEIPLLVSDFDALAFTNASVTIDERDQDLVSSIILRLEKILTELKSILKITEPEMKQLANKYCEILEDGEIKFQVQGFHTD